MKQIRISLSVLAFALAIGGTLATTAKPNRPLAITGWEYIASANECVERTVECNTTSNNLCTFGVNNHKVGNSSDISTQCGTQLKRP